MTESLGWLRLAVVMLVSVVVPAIGYVVRMALAQSNLKTRLETMERRCSTTHGQLDTHLHRISEKLERVGNEVSGLHAKVDMLIQLNGGKRRS
jgi:hypothetical protein